MAEPKLVELTALDTRFVYIADAGKFTDEEIHRLSRMRPGEIVRVQHPEAIMSAEDISKFAVMRAALFQIASLSEALAGATDLSELDEPSSARLARKTLKDLGFIS